jgi:hypothetical protein
MYRIVLIIILLIRVSGDLRTYRLRLIYSSGVEGGFKVKGGFKATIAVRMTERRKSLNFIKQSIIL